MAKEHNLSSNTKAALNTLPLIIMLISQSGSYMPQTHAITGEEKLGSSMILSDGNNGRFATHQKIATAGNNVYVIWSDNTVEAGNSISNSTSTSNSFDIFFRRSIDNGDSFGDVVNLSNNSGDSNFAQIVTSGKNVYVVWQDNSLLNDEIFFKKSSNGGHTFGDVVNLSNNNGVSRFQQIASSGNNVYVIWSDNTVEAGNSISNSTSTSNSFDIFIRRSIDNGDSFGDVVNLSNNEDDNNKTSNYIDSLNPRLAVTPRSTIATNNNNNTDTTTATTTTTTTTTTINNNSSSNNNNNNNDNLYVVWTGCNTMSDEPECDVFFIRSKDGGHTFGDVVNLSNTKASSPNPEMAASMRPTSDGSVNDDVYLVWQDDTLTSSGNNGIFLRRSIDNGDSFGDVVNLSNNNNNGVSRFQQIASSGNNVYVIWSDNTVEAGNSISNSTSTSNSFDIFFRKSTDNGDSFGDVVNLSNNNGSSSAPQIAVLTAPINGDDNDSNQINNDDNDLYVVWSDNSAASQQQILLTSSKDGGHTFGDVVNLSNNEDDNNKTSNYIDSLNPRLAVTPRSTIATNNNNNTDTTTATTTTTTSTTTTTTINTTTNNNSRSNNNNNDNLYVVWTGCNTMSDEPECDVFFMKVP